MTTDNVQWLNDHEAVVNAKLIEDAGRTIPFGVYANVADPKAVTGYIFIGQPVPSPLDPAKAAMPFTGARISLGGPKEAD
jgi:hypothetical protein